MTLLPRPRFSFGLLILMALVLGACGGSTSENITSVGHGEGDHNGHDLAVGANTPQEPGGRHYLHHGDRGADVETLQQRLVELGAPLGTADGIFGDETLHAVLIFQRSEGLPADGVVGTSTWAQLDSPTQQPEWNIPEIPSEYATDPPQGSGSSNQPSGAATRGDGANVGPHQAPGHDPAAGSGAWARAVISLSDETATFYDESGAIVLQAPISSGKNGLTPAGTFHVQSKSERATAQGGTGVYMNHMTRFNGGIGFHSIPKRADGTDIATPLGERPVSHGCIRMNDDQAKLVFENLPIGALIEVHA